MIPTFEKPKPQVKPCANCGYGTTTSDGADLYITELLPPSKDRMSRQPAKKVVLKIRLCKDCMEKAEVVIADWLDIPKGER